MLLELVEKKIVSGWDDPRMPTLSGMRRRGYTPQAIKNFCQEIGIAKADSTVDMAFLEHFIREDLNRNAPRVMAVLNPLKVIIDNYPEGYLEELDAINNPEDPASGRRKGPFQKYFILKKMISWKTAGQILQAGTRTEVRLRYAYFIKCESAIKDSKGNITELHCTYDPATKGGDAPDGRKVKSTIHWSRQAMQLPQKQGCMINYSRSKIAKVQDGEDFKDNINPSSLNIADNCMLEPSLAAAKPGDIFQFERLGYFCADPDSRAGKPVFNRTATLKDEWTRLKGKIK